MVIGEVSPGKRGKGVHGQPPFGAKVGSRAGQAGLLARGVWCGCYALPIAKATVGNSRGTSLTVAPPRRIYTAFPILPLRGT